MRQIFKHPIAKHPLVYLAGLLFITIIVVIPIVAFANTPTFTEYSLPVSTAHSAYIVAGPDGNMWFTEMENNKVAYISPDTRKITEFSLPQTGVAPDYNSPTGLAKGPDGNMWFTDEFTEKISKITPSGTVTAYPLPNGALQPDGIVSGPDGNLWITVYGTNTIDVMNTSGTVLHAYPVAGGPEGISVGPDGNIWFAEQNANKIVKMNPSNGATTAYSAATTTIDTAPGTDGNVWFTLLNSKQVGKINPGTGNITYYALPSSTGSIASFITPGPDGNMWFSLSYVGLGTVNPSTGAVSSYQTPSASTGGAWGIAAGPDKNIWYTVNNNFSKIGVANLGLGGSSGSGSNSGSGGSGGSGSGSDSGSGSGSGQGGSSSGSGSSQSGGSGGSSNSGGSGSKDKECPTAQAQEHSASECSVEAPGHNKLTGPTTTTTLSTGVVVTADKQGVSTATVATDLDLSSQTYTVPNNQTLFVDGKLGKTVVSKGAVIKGNGKVAELTVDKGGELSPGHSPGCLSASSLTILGTYSAQLGGASACTAYDQVASTGSTVLGGELSASFVNAFHPQTGQSFVILNNKSSKPVSGTFADLPEGSIMLIGNTPLSISYKGGNGNDVTLTALSKDAYLSTLATPKGGHVVAPGELSTLASFVRRNATIILATQTAALLVVIGLIYLLVRAHAKKTAAQPPAPPATPGGAVTPQAPPGPPQQAG